MLDYGRVGPKRVLHGGYLEGGYAFLRGSKPEDGFGRLMLRGQGRVLVNGDGQMGGGAAIQVTGEWGGFLSTGNAAARGAFAAYGEGTIGVYSETSASVIDNGVIWTTGLGLFLRIPATLVVVAGKK
jgi:hypothetical protein